ncbi:MAG: hypothetical protein E7466_02880 [Ruminococcaceae bacterium]|nr:hypothetical protein [Oscillospiraceae bacterium]
MRGNLEQGKLRVRIPSGPRIIIGAVEYLWVFLVILNGNSIFHSNSSRKLYLLEAVLVVTFLLLAMNLAFYKCQPSRKGVLGAVTIMAYTAVYFCVMENTMSASVFLELFVAGGPMLFMLFSELYRHGRLFSLMRRFADVMCILAVVSLFFWISGEVLGLIQPNGYVNITWGNFNVVKGYYGIHYAFQYDTTFFPDQHLLRNSGIFSEAPMFNLWLNLAVAIELFLKPRASKLRIVLLAVTIVTTLSVTGILFLVLCVLLFAISHIRSMNKLQTCMMVLMALVVLPVLAYVVYHSMTLKVDTDSYEMRISDYSDGIQLWMDYPIFGAGFGNLVAFKDYVYTPMTVSAAGFSNSIIAVLGTGGAWMALLYYIPHFGMVVPRWTGSKKLSCFGICTLYLFVTTIFFARFLGVLLVVFGYVILFGDKNPEYTPERDSKHRDG